MPAVRGAAGDSLNFFVELQDTRPPLLDFQSRGRTIIRRESPWQSRVLRNHRTKGAKPEKFRSLNGQVAQLRPLTRGTPYNFERLTGGACSLVRTGLDAEFPDKGRFTGNFRKKLPVSRIWP